jgi:hypothetical protein
VRVPRERRQAQQYFKIRLVFFAFFFLVWQLTWDQALNSTVSLVPKPVDWKAKHEVPGLAIPGQYKAV